MEQFFKWEGKALTVAMQDKHQFIISSFKYYPQWDLFIPLQESEVDEVVRSLINSIPDDGEQRKSKNSNMPHI